MRDYDLVHDALSPLAPEIEALMPGHVRLLVNPKKAPALALDTALLRWPDRSQPGRFRGVHDMPHHGPSQQWVKHFREGRLHPGASAGSEDDGEVIVFGLHVDLRALL